ncbi:MAG TPA: chorismate mutase [Thermomicrobiaceae bacterium]|nr:chorismate mutase [Thermomicrobiaceae bacterium]
MLRCRGIRGATTVERNTAEDILEATRELFLTLVAANDLIPDEVASIIFTTTVDLNATFPAAAVREHGWTGVPLLNSHEMNVPGSLDRVIRVLVHYNTEKPADAIRHVYLRRAVQLRPEWAYDVSSADSSAGHDAPEGARTNGRSEHR